MHTPSKTATMRDPLRTASTPCVPRRAYSRLRIRRRLLPLLAGLTLTSGLALAAIAYAGMRAYAPANELGIVLLLVTLLETALAVFCGLRFSGAPSNATLDRLDARLNDVASSAADLEQLVRAQVGRSQRQERLARQVSDSTREFNTLMEAVEQGQAALRETSSEIWAGMSQPGQALDPATATRLARQSAIIAGRIGAATEDSRERCRYLIGMMNQVIAEGRVLGDEGRVLEARANALRTSIERVEMTLGAKVVCRQYDLPGNPFARRRRASRQLSDLASNGTPSGAYPRAGWQPAFNPSASQPAAPNGVSLSGAHTVSGIFPRDVQPGQGGQSSAQSSAQTTGQSSQWRPSQSSQWPEPALPFEQARPRTPTGPLPTANPPSSMNPATNPPTNPSVTPRWSSPGQPPATPTTPERGDPARRVSRPLWSDAGLRTPSFPGGSLPGISLPGVSDVSFSSQKPSFPGTSPSGLPPFSNSSGQVPRRPGQEGDWSAGKHQTPGNMPGKGVQRPWWTVQPPNQLPRQPTNHYPASQPPTSSSPRWSPDGVQPPLPPNGAPPNGTQQPGPDHDAPSTGWLND